MQSLETQLHQTEGTSEGANDNKLAYLRLLSAAITREDVNTLLIAIEALQAMAVAYLQINQGIGLPAWSGANICNNPRTYSAPLIEVGGRVYATFANIPSDTHDVVDQQTGLHSIHANYAPYWQGTKIYVESTAPTFKLSAESNELYPTGAYITITSAADIGIYPSVPSGNTLSIHLCIDNVAQAPACMNVVSLSGGGAVFSNFPNGLSTATPAIQNGITNAGLANAAGFSGWKIKLLAYTGADYIRVYTASGATLQRELRIADIGIEYTLTNTPATSNLYFLAFDAQFTIQLCAPQ
jgi:hypothetical protein